MYRYCSRLWSIVLTSSRLQSSSGNRVLSVCRQLPLLSSELHYRNHTRPDKSKVLLTGVSIATASQSRAMATQLSSKLELHGVVPDVIATSPHDVIQVTYPSGVKVDIGNVLTPSDVRDPPQINLQADPTALYTVVMTDPDAPSRKEPKFGQWRHWIKINISGGDLTSGQSVSEYVGSGPPVGTGLHRYVFLVYKQSGQMIVDSKLKTSKNKASGREKWNATDFAADYQLGNPIAANFFLAEYDNYVPTLYEQFTEE